MVMWNRPGSAARSRRQSCTPCQVTAPAAHVAPLSVTGHQPAGTPTRTSVDPSTSRAGRRRLEEGLREVGAPHHDRVCDGAEEDVVDDQPVGCRETAPDGSHDERGGQPQRRRVVAQRPVATARQPCGRRALGRRQVSGAGQAVRGRHGRATRRASDAPGEAQRPGVRDGPHVELRLTLVAAPTAAGGLADVGHGQGVGRGHGGSWGAHGWSIYYTHTVKNTPRPRSAPTGPGADAGNLGPTPLPELSPARARVLAVVADREDRGAPTTIADLAVD